MTVKASSTLNALRYDESITFAGTKEIYEMFVNYNTSMLYFYSVEENNCTTLSIGSEDGTLESIIEDFVGSPNSTIFAVN